MYIYTVLPYVYTLQKKIKNKNKTFLSLMNEREKYYYPRFSFGILKKKTNFFLFQHYNKKTG